MNEFLKIVCFSDTHGKHQDLKLGSGDILLFAGDCMGSGYNFLELSGFMEWLEKQDFEHKIMIAGNHDHYMEKFPEAFRRMVNACPSVTYLCDSGIEIAGIKIWGTPHSRKFHNWAFNRSEKFMQLAFNQIPEDTDILLSHAPARGIMDFVEDGTKLGEQTLINTIFDKLHNLKFHVFGHIHHAYGTLEYQNGDHNKITAINCAVLDENYELKNEPIAIEYGYRNRTEGAGAKAAAVGRTGGTEVLA